MTSSSPPLHRVAAAAPATAFGPGGWFRERGVGTTGALARSLRRWGRVAALLTVLPATAPSGAQTSVEPDAQRLLKTSMAFVGGLGKFSLQGRSTLEVALKSGQKIQLGSPLEGVVQRPDRMRVRRGSGPDEDVFVFDGKSLTLWRPALNEYASLPAPQTIDKMLDFARERLGVVAPLADVVTADGYAVMMDGVTSGFVVGQSLVEGVACDHLAFRAPHVDWQIWIERGERPLPRKMVITTRDIPNEPQFEVVITKWDRQPRIEARRFEFVAPKGAQRLEPALPAAGSAWQMNTLPMQGGLRQRGDAGDSDEVGVENSFRACLAGRRSERGVRDGRARPRSRLQPARRGGRHAGVGAPAGPAGNRGVGAPGVRPGGGARRGARDPGFNQPGIAGNVGGVARQTVRRF